MTAIPSIITVTHHPRLSAGGSSWRFDPTMTYEQPDGNRPKPKGLWLSVDDDWRRWCEEENFALEDLEHSVVFDLDLTRCVVLTDESEIDEFHFEYLATTQSQFGPNDELYGFPDWDLVTWRYAGIVIAPYVWSRRLDGGASAWYYGWDCASACVWDLSVLRLVSNG